MEKRIYYHDTDVGGVVYYANYLKYMEEARSELLEQKGVDVKGVTGEKFLYAVRKCSIVYKSPARYGDVIVADAEIKKVTHAQIIFRQKVYEKDSRRILVEAEVSIVTLNSDFKPVAMPDSLRQKLLN